MALITKHFKEKELICPCCGKQKMGSLFMDLVEACRVISRIPFRVTSGWRCEWHNREIGGHPTSAHMEGLAIDIARSSPTKDRDILEAATKVGFVGIEIGSRHFHFDLKPRSHGRYVLWTAKSK